MSNSDFDNAVANDLDDVHLATIRNIMVDREQSHEAAFNEVLESSRQEWNHYLAEMQTISDQRIHDLENDVKSAIDYEEQLVCLLPH